MQQIFRSIFLQHWFWILSTIFLVLFFSLGENSFIQSFYFVSFFLPVFLITSWYVNSILVPEYLIRKRYGHFTLYAFYTLIISTYAHFLIIYIAIYLFTLFQMGAEHIITISISSLSLSMYILIVVKAFIHIFHILNQKELTIHALEEQIQKREEQMIQVRYNRKTYPIRLDQIQFIESYSDYIKIHLQNEIITTKESIGRFHQQLPDQFIRIHRSYIINRNYVSSYNKAFVSLGDTQLPLSRSYKQEVLQKLEPKHVLE